MKANGIIIYTIIPGPTPNATTRKLHETCAPEPSYCFNAPESATLASAFKTIGQTLSDPRMARRGRAGSCATRAAPSRSNWR